MSILVLHSPFVSNPLQLKVTSINARKSSVAIISRPSASYQVPAQRIYKEEGNDVVKDLKGEVRLLFSMTKPSEQIQLIDTIERLGLGYHFEDEIDEMLNSMLLCGYHKVVHKNGLYDTALLFRLLRQNAFMVSEDVFNEFKDKDGCIKESLSCDSKGLLELYEASYLSFGGEKSLDMAREFAVKNLKIPKSNLPSHWNVRRLQARRHIETYKTDQEYNHTLLSLAKLDFNMVQKVHKKEFKSIMSWWMNIGIFKELSFFEDNMMECFFVATSTIYQPQYVICLQWLPKICALTTILDDVYDVHGSYDELEIFTHAIDRWEIEEVENLPQSMQRCFRLIHDIVNEISYSFEGTDRRDIVPHLKNAWANLSKTILTEAKWHHTKYTPKFDEYLDNGWISTTGPLLLLHIKLFLNQESIEEAMNIYKNCQQLVKLSSTIFRLNNDLATSSTEQERGDTPTSIQCFMNEFDVTEIVAREHISKLIFETWKDMNREFVACSSYPRTFTNACVNMARMSALLYHNGEDRFRANQETKKVIASSFLNPII